MEERDKQSQNKQKLNEINPGDSLNLVIQIKRQKNPSYPYYVVGDTYSDLQKNIDFLIIIQLNRQNRPLIIIYPFAYKKVKEQKVYTKLKQIQIQLDGLPERQVSILKVQKLTYSIINTNYNETLKVNLIQFVVGYRAGYLINAKYQNKNIQIVSKMNRMKNKQGFFTKATNYIFSQEEYYKRWAKGAVMKVIQHHIFKNRQAEYQPCYSYQIGKYIYILPQMNEEVQQKLQEIYQQINWKDPYLFQKSTASLLHLDNSYYRAIKYKSSFMIQFKDSLVNYQLSYNDLYLFAVIQSSIFIIDLKSMLINEQICFQIAIRNISLCKSFFAKDIEYLIVMPYDDTIYIFELKKQKVLRYCKFGSHRAFIMQAIIDKECILTAGADHRIGITPINKINTWQYVSHSNQKVDFFDENQIKKQLNKKNQAFQRMKRDNVSKIIQKQKVVHKKIQVNQNIQCSKWKDIYSLGEYNNARNNLHDYGFGEVIQIGQKYCFFNLDGKIKIFQV